MGDNAGGNRAGIPNFACSQVWYLRYRNSTLSIVAIYRELVAAKKSMESPK